MYTQMRTQGGGVLNPPPLNPKTVWGFGGVLGGKPPPPPPPDPKTFFSFLFCLSESLVRYTMMDTPTPCLKN